MLKEHALTFSVVLSDVFTDLPALDSHGASSEIFLILRQVCLKVSQVLKVEIHLRHGFGACLESSGFREHQ